MSTLSSFASHAKRGRGTIPRRGNGGGGEFKLRDEPRPFHHPLFGGRSPFPVNGEGKEGE